MSMELQGMWKSDSVGFESLIFNETSYILCDEEGRWAIDSDQIWLLSSDGKTGTKWFFKFEDSNKLVLYQPEDFLYQGGSEYIYIQMTNPNLRIEFFRT